MSLILNIDTSLETAFVCVAENGIPLHILFNSTQKEHAGFLHEAIKEINKIVGINLPDYDAIAVTQGPGSYTGLRVGMASAKGLCYATNKPYIEVGTLNMMAQAMCFSLPEKKDIIVCPLIDARRMEVFTALFSDQMVQLKPAEAVILGEDSFEVVLNKKQVYFGGSGANKFEGITRHSNAHFIGITQLPAGMSHLSHLKFSMADFSDLAHSEPLYVKEFHSS